MAVDEVLLARLASGDRPPMLRLWRWTDRALVIGSHQSVANEIDPEAARELGFVVVRRMSGGGTMIAEPGRTITYSLYLPERLVADISFRDSYRMLDAFAVKAFRALGVDAGYRPINDIVSPVGKIGGAAQARRRGLVLHHTTIAYAMDPSLVRRLIRLGRPDISRIGVRSAEREVSPLDTLTAASLERVETELLREFAREHMTDESELLPAELQAAETLVATKYGSEAWTYRLP